MASLTKTASKDSISSANALIAKLSNSDNTKDLETVGVIKNLIDDIHSSKKREKVASLIEDMVSFSQIDESDVDDEILKFANFSDDELKFEKRAFQFSVDKLTNESSLFGEQGVKTGSQKKDLDSFLN